MYAYRKTLRFLDHTRRYSIVATPEGWQLREELDSQVIRQAQYHDWHRVERARHSIAIELENLREKGWAEVN